MHEIGGLNAIFKPTLGNMGTQSTGVVRRNRHKSEMTKYAWANLRRPRRRLPAKFMPTINWAAMQLI